MATVVAAVHAEALVPGVIDQALLIQHHAGVRIHHVLHLLVIGRISTILA
jgi:hypothetical protein